MSKRLSLQNLTSFLTSSIASAKFLFALNLAALQMLAEARKLTLCVAYMP
jgi:hypothetical protein